MAENGMQEVLNPSLYFLESAKESKVGVCPGVIREGNRLMLIEMQALTAKTFFPLPKRVAEGLSRTRVEVLTAIIAKFTKYELSDQDIYVNIAGGLRAQDPLLDLPAILAMISSFTGKSLPHGLVAFGEVSLTGQIRINKRAEQMEKECKRLGYDSFHKKYPQIKHISQLFLFFQKV
jgi:DNA repair protein RadA/Sms